MSLYTPIYNNLYWILKPFIDIYSYNFIETILISTSRLLIASLSFLILGFVLFLDKLSFDILEIRIYAFQ